ncbi:hypothetical protein D5400_17075 [Georhizobium profundi]|uniref:Uncharacterized protein n=1 Tax=Georhizobium profundi TaxID=2341112 RepID=A0A3S9B739_9HYPH|nr:helix-turn-helix domain-containing protein [Georhizobium profundi]AZN72759.1 hypothetical protein D5400_17075 [Georhizobium profundi]
MAAPFQKMVGVQVSVTARAKAVLDAQAQARNYSTSAWCGLLFDMAFAAVCAREKGAIHTDADLDAIVGACLLLHARAEWDTAEIAQKLGVPEATIVRILDTWREYRRGEV